MKKYNFDISLMVGWIVGHSWVCNGIYDAGYSSGIDRINMLESVSRIVRSGVDRDAKGRFVR